MNLQRTRGTARDPRDPVLHDLPPVRVDGRLVAVHLSLRRDDMSMWRGWLRFADEEAGTSRATAEIFCAVSEQDLWQSVHGMREHHLRDLYRSLD
jgi:hypothetical protein